MITYKCENVSEIWEEALPLFEHHWEEVEDYAINEHPTPKVESYANLEEKGLFKAMIARNNGKLVGYCFFYLYNHMHYPHKIYALNDVLFLLPEYRRTNAGINLMKEAEKMVVDAGAVSILWAVRDFRDFSPVLKRMGYHKQETVYFKNLG
jgi:GNAT superfamily N-acetyltransferase